MEEIKTLPVQKIDQLILQCKYLSELKDLEKIFSKLSKLTEEFHNNRKNEDWNDCHLLNYLFLNKLIRTILQRIGEIITLSEDKNGLSKLEEIQRLVQSEEFNLAASLSIVEKQPPQVLKQKNTFDVTFRCLYMNEDYFSKCEVNCCLISDKEFDDIQNNWHQFGQVPLPSYKSLENSSAKLEYQNGKLCAFFQQLRLKKVKTSPSRRLFLHEKLALFFYTTILIDNEPIRIWSISQPLVLIVHVNQECLAQGTIWWDTEFPQIPRHFFTIRETIKCNELTEKLAIYAYDYTKQSLNDINKEFIRKKLQTISDNDWISFKKFHREPLPGTIFPFWEWFYQLMKLLKPDDIDDTQTQYIELDYSVQSMWSQGLITGFISKEMAIEILQKQPIGTLLLRFSESRIGSLHVVYKSSNGSILMCAPWDQWQLKNMNISATIYNLDNPLFLYSPYIELQQLDLILNPYTMIAKPKEAKCNTLFQPCFVFA